MLPRPPRILDNVPVPMRFAPRRRRLKQIVQQEPLSSFGVVLVIVALILIVVGAAETGSAEHERLHGWQRTMCMVEHNYGAHNDSTCIYLSVIHQNRSLCAVPASIAARAWFHEPPACNGFEGVDKSHLDYWRSIRSALVECLVPDVAVDANRCLDATTSRSVGAAVWRSWIDRFVYVVRYPRDGDAALSNVTAPRRGVGLGVLIGGGVVLCIACICVFHRSGARALARASPSRIYRERHARRHKMY